MNSGGPGSSGRRAARVVGGVLLVGAMLAVTSFAPDERTARARRVERLSRRARDAYEQQRYTDAADAYRQLVDSSPFDHVLHFNHACALARDGKADEAIRSLEAAVRYGFEDAELIEKAGALESLRSDARFAKVVRDARASRDEAVVVHVPPNLDPGRPAPLVVLIHGRGSAPRGVLPAWTAAAERLGVVLALPKGPTRVAAGRYAWEAPHALGNVGLDWSGCRAAVARAVDAAAAACPHVDRNRIILAGFSQGGYVALAIVHEEPERYLGVVTFVTVYHAAAIGPWDGARPKRAYLVAGSRDPLCPQSRAARDTLVRAGFDVRYDEVEGMSHEIPPAYERRQLRALRFVLSGRDE